MLDIVALGELLIDFTPCGLSSSGSPILEQNPGGAPANRGRLFGRDFISFERANPRRNSQSEPE